MSWRGAGRRAGSVRTGADREQGDSSIITFDSVKTGRNIPQWENLQLFPNAAGQTGALARESLHARDHRIHRQSRRNRNVTAGYAMAQGRVGKLAGLSHTSVHRRRASRENGDVEAGAGCAPASPAPPRSRPPIPWASAQRDYADTQRRLEGSYTKSFPSAHLTHDITPNLKARLSWSTSFGRPALAATLAERNHQRGEPDAHGQQPEPAAADGDELGCDAGVLFRARRQSFRRLVPQEDHRLHRHRHQSGHDSRPAPTTATTANTPASRCCSRRQRRHRLRAGLGVRLPAAVHVPARPAEGARPRRRTTRSSTRTAILAAPRIAGPVRSPASFRGRATSSCTWRYRSFSARVLYNYAGEYITTYSAASAARNIYRYAL